MTTRPTPPTGPRPDLHTTSCDNPLDSRQIRIFVSSTFRDMNAERDYLMTKVFPRLRLKAAERDVSLVGLDLRWGITEEEARRGETVGICLREIDNSRPFFLGLLGDRYGWQPRPDELADTESLRERYPWLDADLREGASITEIEMQYGALRAADSHALFFLKRGSDASHGRLHRLKEAVRRHPRCQCAEYDTPEQLGSRVEEALTQLLDQLFPPEPLTPAERERRAQRAFLHSRCGLYLRDERNFSALDDFLRSDDRCLVVTGPSGMGKSSLLANWIGELQRDPSLRVIYHFVGCAGDEGDPLRIQRRLIDELRSPDGLREAPDLLPERDETPERTLQRLLSAAAAGGPLVILLDGVNQLADTPDAKLLGWLPEPPAGVKYLFSTLDDDPTMALFRRRRYPVFTVRPLDDGLRRRFVAEFLRHHGKSLTDSRITRIVSAPVTRNTLVLRTLLDELIAFGSHERLDACIDDYLSAPDPGNFFLRVLRRAEEDYGAQLVREALSLIALSRAGLSESELLRMTGVTPLRWSHFYCAFASHFTVTDGRLRFFHSYLLEAVQQRYLRLGEERAAGRHRIIDFMNSRGAFAGGEPCERGRACEELAHQYHQADMPAELHALLLDRDAFLRLSREADTLGRYWRTLLDTGRYSPAEYLHSAPSASGRERADFLFRAANFISCQLSEYTHLCEPFITEAVGVGRRLAAQDPAFGTTLANYLNSLGNLLRDRQEFGASAAAFDEALAIVRRLEGCDPARQDVDLAMLHINLGWTLEELGDFQRAERIYREELVPAEAADRRDPVHCSFVAALLIDLSALYRKMGLIDPAERTGREALALCREEVGRRADMQSRTRFGLCLTNLANIHWEEMGRFDLAEPEYREALAVRRALAAENPACRHDLVHTLQCCACMYDRMQRYDRSLQLYTEALSLVRDLDRISPEPYPLFDLLFHLGVVHTMQGAREQAAAAYEEALRTVTTDGGGYLFEESPYFMDTVARTLQNLASLCHARGDLERAVALDAQGLTILRRLRDEEAAERGCDNPSGPAEPDASAADAPGETGPALHQALRLHLGYLIQLAGQRYAAGDSAQAREAYLQLLELCRELEEAFGDRGCTREKIVFLNRLGIIACNEQRYDEAESRLLTAFDLALALYEQDNDAHYDLLASVCGNVASFYRMTGRPDLAAGFDL